MKRKVMDMKRNALRLLLPLAVLGVMSAMGIRAITTDERIDLVEIENRYGNDFPEFEDSLWLSGEWQSMVTKALNDHLPYAIDTKTLFFKLRNGVLYEAQKRMYNFTDYYVHFRNDIYLYGEEPNLLYRPRPLTEVQRANMRVITSGINREARRHPGVGFYVYYVTRDFDIRFDIGYDAHKYDTLVAQLQLPKAHISCLKLKDFEQFKHYFYRTDHHWQCFGSYRGYRDVFALLRLAEQGEQINRPVKVPDAGLGIDDEERVTDEEGNQAVLVSRFHHESKARSTGTPKKFHGYMYAYQFHYVPMQITRDGESYQYGDDEKYLHNKEVWIEDGIRYGLMYGRDEGELIFDTGRRERPNILVMGDSFDNAVLRLLAGHYNQLHSIDLRHYETQKGHAFNMSEYIRKNDISTVLFLGNNGLFMAVRFTKF